MSFFKLLDPITRHPLEFIQVGHVSGFGYLHSGHSSRKWPVAFGIGFLRSDRVELAQKVVTFIEENDHISAVAYLLQDTDNFAPQQPLLEDCQLIAKRMLVNDTSLLAIDVMEACKFGPVANYFAIRGSAPTFLSGLGLLKLGAIPTQPFIEIGCGAGHFLYWLKKRHMNVLGTDTVFSKLFLAHRFLNIEASQLLCASAGNETQLPIETLEATNIFCHDVFYFIKDKIAAVDDFRRMAGDGGHVMVGHAHLSSADHGAVSGYPLSLSEYQQIACDTARFYDDANLADYDQAVISTINKIEKTAEAISFIEGEPQTGGHHWWRCDDELHCAPLQMTFSKNEGVTKMDWPSPAFEKEYQSSTHLISSVNPFEYLPFYGDETSLPLKTGLPIPASFLSFGIRPLRWGVIGGGWIAKDYFEPAFEFVPHAQLVAVCDTNPERLAHFSANSSLQTFVDIQEMLASCHLDAVYISTPNHLHAAIFEKLSEYGIRVLCEKPLATNLDDINRIEHSALQKPHFFQTAFDQRYHPAHQQLARHIAEGVIGQVTQIRIHYACWVGDDWNKASSTENWRIYHAQAGGGAGFDLLPHCLDLALMLVNDSVTDAHLLYQNMIHEYSVGQGVDDGALLSIKTAKGILASMHVAYNCPEDQVRRRIELIGTHGRVEALNTMGQDAGGKLIWQINGAEKYETFSDSNESGPFVRQLDAVTRLWLRADQPSYPIQRDIQLAKLLVDCDKKVKNITKESYSLS